MAAEAECLRLSAGHVRCIGPQPPLTRTDRDLTMARNGGRVTFCRHRSSAGDLEEISPMPKEERASYRAGARKAASLLAAILVVLLGRYIWKEKQGAHTSPA